MARARPTGRYGQPTPEACHLSATAVSRKDGLRQAVVLVFRTLAFVNVRRVLDSSG